MAINKEEERLRIGRELAARRKEKQMNQTQVAEKCGLQQAHIARIETGRFSVGLDTLAAVADALDCTVEIIGKADNRRRRTKRSPDKEE